MALLHDDIVKNVLSKIKEIKGVHQTLVLTEEDRRKTLELEEEAQKHVMMGIGYGNNQGVRTVLQRDVAIAFVTDNEYVWPPGPNLILKWKDRVIGEEVTDPKKLDELKKTEGIALIGNFAVYKDRMPAVSDMVKMPSTVLFPPKPCLEIKEVKGVFDAIQASPCASADDYLKKRMKANLTDQHLGTALIGFNLSHYNT